MNELISLFVLVFLGGVISSLSPCTLGLLPLIIGYIGGYSKTSNKKIIIQLLFFVIGLSLVLTMLGIVSALAGKAFGFWAKPVWSLIIASFIMIMGLNLLEIIEIPIPSIIKQMPQNKNNSLILYPILLGGIFAFATTPCSTPILAGIMAYASLKANIFLGGALLFFYALGQGIILVLAGLFTSLLKKIMVFKQISQNFVKISGIVLILVSIYIYLSVFGVF
ncbi:MAG: cytochrome c biogenesis protein CcdA [bacterium]